MVGKNKLFKNSFLILVLTDAAEVLLGTGHLLSTTGMVVMLTGIFVDSILIVQLTIIGTILTVFVASLKPPKRLVFH